MSLWQRLKKIPWLQIIGGILAVVGAARLLDGQTLNGATWLLLGISVMVYQFPVQPDGHVRWGLRSILGYAAMVAAFVLMLAHVLLN